MERTLYHCANRPQSFTTNKVRADGKLCLLKRDPNAPQRKQEKGKHKTKHAHKRKNNKMEDNKETVLSQLTLDALPKKYQSKN